MKMLKLTSIAAFLAMPFIASANPGPPASVPEPTTVLAGAACLIPLGVAIASSFRKPRK